MSFSRILFGPFVGPLFKMVELDPRFTEDVMDLCSFKDIPFFSLAECEMSRLLHLRKKRRRKKMMMKRRGSGVISQEVNLRPPIKVRLNKSFLSRKELTRRFMSKGDDNDSVGFNSCIATEDSSGILDSESVNDDSSECLVHQIDTAIVKELNERAEAIDRDTPMGRIRGAIQQKIT